MIELEFLGKPIPNVRHRTCGRRAYDPQSQLKKKLKWGCYPQMECQDVSKIFDNPVEVDILLIFEIPKSYSKKRKAETLNKFKTSKPDVDNCAKFYLDVLSGVAYADDQQVSKLTIAKVYGETAKTLIKIKPLA